MTFNHSELLFVLLLVFWMWAFVKYTRPGEKLFHLYDADDEKGMISAPPSQMGGPDTQTQLTMWQELIRRFFG